MAYKKRSERKRASGGMAGGKINQYNAQGSPEDREESEKSEGFRKGGHVEGEGGKHHLGKRARGGSVNHHHDHDGKGHTSIAVHHHNHKRGGKIEKRARGGGVRGMSGGAPFSSGRHSTAPSNKMGSPGEQAPSED